MVTEITTAQLRDVKDIRDYMFGGKSEFTLHSLKTDNHFSYKIINHSEKPDHCVRFVFFLGGSNNDTDWVYAGTLKRFRRNPERLAHTGEKNNQLSFNLTMNSPKKETPVMVAFRWMVFMLNHDKISDDLEFMHSGKCSACGHKLTTPESIRTGMGPVCRSRL